MRWLLVRGNGHRDQSVPVDSDLLSRQFAANLHNQVWLADLTYITAGEGWLYLAAIMDLHTRKLGAERQSEIVGWSMRNHLRAGLAIAALMMAIRRQQRPHADMLRAIGLYATEVTSHVRALLATLTQVAAE